MRVGTNGGPPSIPLNGWRDFRAAAGPMRRVCAKSISAMTTSSNIGPRPTTSRPRSRNIPAPKCTISRWYLSARFDESGVLAGLRMVSDPRDTSRDRDEAYLLRTFLTARFGRDGWECVDLPLRRRRDAGGTNLHQATAAARRSRGAAVADIETHFFRKKGQSQIDPQSGRMTEGQFESLVRFELTLVK